MLFNRIINVYNLPLASRTAVIGPSVTSPTNTLQLYIPESEGLMSSNASVPLLVPPAPLRLAGPIMTTSTSILPGTTVSQNIVKGPLAGDPLASNVISAGEQSESLNYNSATQEESSYYFGTSNCNCSRTTHMLIM